MNELISALRKNNIRILNTLPETFESDNSLELEDGFFIQISRDNTLSLIQEKEDGTFDYFDDVDLNFILTKVSP